MSDPVREHHSILAAAEKRLLIAIAARLPRAVTSDQLTLLAFVSMGLAGLGFALGGTDPRWLWMTVAALGLNWFGDSLDGTLARVRRLERPRYGYYIDHVVDIVGITALLTGLACSGFMTPVIALAMLIAYLLVSGEVFLATAVHSVFRMSFAGVGPTELRIILAIGAVALRTNPHVGSFLLFDFGGVIAIGGLAVAMAVSVTRNARVLARLEPLPLEPPRPCSTMVHLGSSRNPIHGDPRHQEAGAQSAGGARRAHP